MHFKLGPVAYICLSLNEVYMWFRFPYLTNFFNPALKH